MIERFLGSGYAATAVVAAVFLLLLVFEAAFPLRRRKHPWFSPWVRRLVINGWMSAAAFVVGTAVVRPMATWLAVLTAERSFGLLNWTGGAWGVQFVAGFLLMDLTFYYWHRLNHVVPLLWRFHNVHHVDPDLDVSTSFRFHFVEILYSTGFRVVQVGLIGISPMTYAVYEICFQCATIFHHSNLRLPIHIERLLNAIVVTPRMHGIHHSDVKNETNSNYSVIFRWWDALHKSLRLGVPQVMITVGVPAYHEPGDNALWNLVVMPFRRQEDYWTFPDGKPAVRETVGGAMDDKTLLE